MLKAAALVMPNTFGLYLDKGDYDLLTFLLVCIKDSEVKLQDYHPTMCLFGHAVQSNAEASRCEVGAQSLLYTVFCTVCPCPSPR
jgi:hypothetical protein